MRSYDPRTIFLTVIQNNCGNKIPVLQEKQAPSGIRHSVSFLILFLSPVINGQHYSPYFFSERRKPTYMPLWLEFTNFVQKSAKNHEVFLPSKFVLIRYRCTRLVPFPTKNCAKELCQKSHQKLHQKLHQKSQGKRKFQTLLIKP